MSDTIDKKAEELASKIDDVMESGYLSVDDWPLVVALIASALRQERESAADAADGWLDAQVKSSGMDDNPAFERLRMKQHATLRAAILKED